MTDTVKQELLRKIPSVGELLAGGPAGAWLAEHPRGLVTDCIRSAVEELRRLILADQAGACGPRHVTGEFIYMLAGRRLEERTSPHLRPAVNATGIILHTNLGRAPWPEAAAGALAAEMSGYVTLEIDRPSGTRGRRDASVEYILTELTGAEAATVVNNNAAATLVALAALAAGKEVIISRGQLIEIGGSFRLPEVMALSGARMVEVGTTNRTHLRDYERAFTPDTAAILRVHPSNYRVVGFTGAVELVELVKLAHARGAVCIDDLGAGALVDLEPFGLPHEPTMGESIAAGADVVLASADKLMGAAQGGVIVGAAGCVERIRAHPLARAVRADKAQLMAIERTLHLFRDPDRLRREHPLYRMLSATPDALRARAEALAAAIAAARGAGPQGEGPGGRKPEGPPPAAEVREGVGYLGSGSLPMEALPTFLVAVTAAGVKPAELARRLRLDRAAVFPRVADDAVLLDVRTVTDAQVPRIAAAVARAVKDETP